MIGTTQTASIIACARWETPYVAEWVVYHLDLGFDRIYLYCNDDDPAAFKSTLDSIDIRYRSRVNYRPYVGQGLQGAMYLDGLSRARPDSDWLCFLDLDEFMVLKTWQTVPCLIEELNRKKIDSLCFNWVFYGNDGHATRPVGPVLQTHRRRSRYVDCHTKHLSRVSCFEPRRLQSSAFPFWHGLTDPIWDGFDRRNVLGHDMRDLLHGFPTRMWSYLADTMRSDAMIDTGYIAHFALKSEEDFRIRVARGTGGNFNGQVKWMNHLNAGEAGEILATMNEVYDPLPAQLSPGHVLWP